MPKEQWEEDFDRIMRDVPRVKDDTVKFRAVEPHPEAVGSYHVIDETIAVLKKYSKLPNDNLYAFLAMNILRTHMMNFYSKYFSYNPILLLSGESGSGKTNVLKLHKFLCYNGYAYVSITDAALSVMLDNKKNEGVLVTPILDEFDDRFTKKDTKILELVKGVFDRELGTAGKTTDPALRGNKRRLLDYDGFSPLVIGMRGLPDDSALLSRVLIVRMIEGRSPEMLPRNEDAQIEEFTPLRAKLVRLAMDLEARMQAAKRYRYDEANNRNRLVDKLEPIMTIAHVIDGPDGELWRQCEEAAAWFIRQEVGLLVPTLNREVFEGAFAAENEREEDKNMPSYDRPLRAGKDGMEEIPRREVYCPCWVVCAALVEIMRYHPAFETASWNLDPSKPLTPTRLNKIMSEFGMPAKRITSGPNRGKWGWNIDELWARGKELGVKVERNISPPNQPEKL